MEESLNTDNKVTFSPSSDFTENTQKLILIYEKLYKILFTYKYILSLITICAMEEFFDDELSFSNPLKYISLQQPYH